MRRKALASALGALALAAGLAGCQANPYANQTVTALVTSIDGTTVTAEVIDDAAMAKAGADGADGAAPSPGGAVSYERQADAVFEVGDESVYATDAASLHPSTSPSDASQTIRFENGSVAEAPSSASLVDGTLTISAGGVYELSGDFTGPIDVTTTDEVRLRLGDLALTGSDDTLLRSAGNLVLELTGGDNTIVSNGTTEGVDDVAPLVDCQGALFIEGDGSLDLVAGGRALSAQTMLAVDGGELSIKSGDDALFSASDLRISGGTLAIDAGDDVAHGDSVLVFEGGDVTGRGKEGLEGERVYLRDGVLTLETSDDGINAAEPEAHDDEGAPEGYREAESCLIAIGGGTIAIDAKGDGIDSNGSIEVRGGETYVSALAPGSGEANAPLDYDGVGVLTGGTMLLLGDGSMGQGFSEADQAYVYARASGSAGQQVVVEDADGQILASHTADQALDVVIATAPGLESGESVQVRVGETTVEAIAVTEAVSGAMGGPGAAGAPGGAPGDANGQQPEPPTGDAQDEQSQQVRPGEPPAGRDEGTPPEPPAGETGTAPAAPPNDGEGETAAGSERPAPATTGEEIIFTVDADQAEALEVGDIVRITFGDGATVERLEAQNGPNAIPSMGGGSAVGGQGRESDAETTAATTTTSST